MPGTRWIKYWSSFVERPQPGCWGDRSSISDWCWLVVISDRLNPVYTIQPVVKPGCTTGLTTGCIHDTASCQSGCTVYTNIQLVVKRVMTTGWMFVYTIQPVVEPVWQPVWNNGLHPVNGAWQWRASEMSCMFNEYKGRAATSSASVDSDFRLMQQTRTNWTSAAAVNKYSHSVIRLYTILIVIT